MELRDYLRVIRRQRWMILFVTVCVIAGYSIFFFTQEPSYNASSKVLLRYPPKWQEMPILNLPSWETRISLIESHPVLDRTVRRLRKKDIDVDPSTLQSGLQVQTEPQTDLVNLRYSGRRPQRVLAINRVLTRVFVQYDRENSQESLTSAQQAIQREAKRVKEDLQQTQERLSHHRKVFEIYRTYRKQQSEMQQLSRRYGDRHPKLQTLENEVESLRSNLLEASRQHLARRNILSDTPALQALKSRIATLNDRVRRMDHRLGKIQTSLDEVTFNKSLLDRSVSVVSLPESTQVSYPTTYRTYGFVLIAGLVLGISTGSFLEYLDDRIVTKFDVHRSLNLPVLGSIPEVEPDQLNLLVNPLRTELSERYQETAALLEHALLQSPTLNTALVTSATAGEGKSYTSLNLSVSLARSGETVLLVDLDLRGRRIHKILGFMNSRGASTVLQGDLELDQTLDVEGEETTVNGPFGWNQLESLIQETPQEGLDVLTSGPVPSNPIRLLKNDNMTHFLSLVSERYGIIILDSPPISSVVDPLIIAKRVDEVILVVQAEKAHQGEVQHAKHMLEDVDASILGVLLNRVKREHVSYYPYYTESEPPAADESLRSV